MSKKRIHPRRRQKRFSCSFDAREKNAKKGVVKRIARVSVAGEAAGVDPRLLSGWKQVPGVCEITCEVLEGMGNRRGARGILESGN